MFSTNKKLIQANIGIPNIYAVSCKSSPYDFEIDQGLICIFRGYEWPFEQKLTHQHHDLITKTYRKQGLIRNCTHHYGNFEMIGRRRSKQSTGTTFCES